MKHRTALRQIRLAAEALTALKAAATHLEALQPALTATDPKASAELSRLLRVAADRLGAYPVPLR